MRCPRRARRLPDRARAHRHDDIAVARERADRGRQLRDGFDEHRLDLARDPDGTCERAAVRGDDRRFACRIDFGEHQRIGRRQHADEVLEQVASARVAMRLEREHEPPAGKAAAHGRDRRRHLGRVVAVVVDQRAGAAAFRGEVAVALEAAADAVELGERLRDGGRGHARLAADRDRGERVLHVVQAGQVELDGQVGRTFGLRDEAHATAVIRDVGRTDARVGGHPVGHDRLGDRRQDLAHVRIVDAEHRDAVERQSLREIDERPLQALEVVAVRLHVIGVDVGDHRHRRREVEKRRVGFVGLGDEEVALAEPRVRIRRQEAPADDERRIETAFGQHRRDEARGRRLAVRAGDRDALLQAHELGQHQRARHDGNPPFARGDDFRVVRRDRRRHDDRIGAGNVRRVVADRHRDAESREARRDGARGEIRTET